MSKELEDLRRQAEKLTFDDGSRIKSLERAELEKMAHELAVHQMELEIQNEELRQTRQEAETMLDRYIDLYDFAPVGYFTIDEHNRIVEVNLTGAHILKIDRMNLLRLSFTRFMDPAESERFYLQRRKACKEGSGELEDLKMLKADDTSFYAQINCVKVGDERLRLALTDVSERQKTNETLVLQKVELETAFKELESFSYSISHDLRAPLRTLDGFSLALLQDYGDKLDDLGKGYLNTVRTSSQLMAKLIDDILNLSRFSRAEMYFDEVNLSELAEPIAHELKAGQPERQAEFVIARDLIVKGDAQFLRVVLRNLIENAWKFSRKSHKTRIELGVAQKDGVRVYFIKDNGAGFDMQYKDKLFKPFQRLHSNKDYEGTGIGLAIVQRVIRRHGGDIWAEAEVGKGATFYFTLGQSLATDIKSK